MISRPAPPFYFDEREYALFRDVLVAVRGHDPGEIAHIERSVGTLEHLAAVIRDSPPIAQETQGDRGVRASREPLLSLLCRLQDYDFDLHIPTKALVGQSFLVAKINFFKTLSYAVAAIPGSEPLRVRLDFEIGQSIYTRLAEELFTTLVTDDSVDRGVRERAAGLLFRIWDERLLTEVDDFAPLLESAWVARTRMRPVLGTMLGTHELFRLFQEASDERVLDYFSADDVPPDEIAAFEEFLFGLAHEEIVRLRNYLITQHRATVSSEEARVLLGHPFADEEHEPGAHGMYTSYKRRRINAQHRAITNVPGPKKTAEQYVMAGLLARGFSS